MKINVSNISIILFEIVAVTIIFFIIKTIISINHQRLIDESQTNEMFLMANELHQSSDDLTNFARSYVVTNDTSYRDKYYKVLAIRNGEQARPKNYNSIYWDIDDISKEERHADEDKVSFKTLIKKLPFVPYELDLLLKSEQNSNDLVNIEVQAFNAMAGKFIDQTGAYTIEAEADQELAISLLYSTEYLVAKQVIMKPIDELIITLRDRRSELARENHQNAYTVFTILIAAIIVFIAGNILIYFYLNHKEAKKQQELDAAMEYSKAKSTFLANMSHEIRTPLNAILGFVDLLKKEVSSETGLQKIKVIQQSSQGLLKVIEDVLDLSKIESDKIEIDPIDFELEKELEVVMSLFQLRMLEANITSHLNISPEVPRYLHADVLRIKQVLINLLSNALKFSSPDQHIMIDVSYQDGLLNVSVQDQGKGIAKEKQKEIFEAFHQEDVSTTREYGGTGLGLAISSKLVHLMGGELKLESTPGQGSRFYFSIPVEKASESNEVLNDTEQVSFQGQHILLVEDNKSNQLLMSLILEELNLNYSIADNGQIALDMFKENNYDLVLMDENMPVMNGSESTKQMILHEEKHNLPHTPIIAVTANAIKGDRERFLKAGMDDYITKPIDTFTLEKILKSYLEN